jgi:hypothetical protein
MASRSAPLPQTCLALPTAQSNQASIAEAARLHRCDHKQQVLDYASGSALECAACLNGRQSNAELEGWYFAHERLDVCQVALNFMRWFNGLRFREVAEGSAVKAAAYLGLCASTVQMPSPDRELALEW